jgi:hypothetical protein
MLTAEEREYTRGAGLHRTPLFDNDTVTIFITFTFKHHTEGTGASSGISCSFRSSAQKSAGIG